MATLPRGWKPAEFKAVKPDKSYIKPGVTTDRNAPSTADKYQLKPGEVYSPDYLDYMNNPAKKSYTNPYTGKTTYTEIPWRGELAGTPVKDTGQWEDTHSLSEAHEAPIKKKTYTDPYSGQVYTYYTKAGVVIQPTQVRGMFTDPKTGLPMGGAGSSGAMSGGYGNYDLADIDNPNYKPYPTYSAPAWDENEINRLTQLRAGSGLRKLKQQLQRTTSKIGGNAQVRRMTLRSALEGYGTGLGEIMSGASEAAQSEYGQKYARTSENERAAYQSQFNRAKAMNDEISEDWQAKLEDAYRRWKGLS